MLKNSKALAKKLLELGFNLISGGTDNHLSLIDLRNFNITGKELERRLDDVHITVNKNAIPNDPETPFVTSGIRIGTPAVTTRGLNADDMCCIAEWIYKTATDINSKNQVAAEVLDLCQKYKLF